MFRKAKPDIEEKNHTFCRALSQMVFIFAGFHNAAFHLLEHFIVSKEGCCRTSALLTKAPRSQWASAQCTQQPWWHFHSSVLLHHYSCRFKKSCNVWLSHLKMILYISAKLFYEFSTQNHLNNFSLSMTSAGAFIKMPQLCSISPAWKTSASITLEIHRILMSGASLNFHQT